MFKKILMPFAAQIRIAGEIANTNQAKAPAPTEIASKINRIATAINNKDMAKTRGRELERIALMENYPNEII